MSVRVRIARGLLSDQRVVINQYAGWLGAEFERSACGHVIKHVAEKINRAAKHRLSAVAVVSGVHASILKDADVVRAAVGFDEVVVGKMNVVVVDIDRRGAALRIGVRRAIGRDADAIVKIGDGVVGDDVARAVYLDRKETSQLVRRIDTRRALAGLIPADETHLILAAKEQIVGDEEVARIGVFGPDACADVFEAAIAHREADRAHHFLIAGKDSNFGVAERETFEDVVMRRHDVEQLVVARAVKDRFSVARAFDGDGLLGRAL